MPKSEFCCQTKNASDFAGKSDIRPARISISGLKAKTD
ncbi:Uncharacterized protein dnm_088270 [Desulfonema magnum]|uniref:Uncharacterized protein n=1 Tax=Desulfonema magnum TaxID=45655 RepID=A0A975BW41_9BACT|nr:Uncharacterized protein dnm_088270 [Desulfonema magnum]